MDCSAQRQPLPTSHTQENKQSSLKHISQQHLHILPSLNCTLWITYWQFSIVMQLVLITGSWPTGCFQMASKNTNGIHVYPLWAAPDKHNTSTECTTWQSAQAEVKVTSTAEHHWQTENVKGVHHYTLLDDVPSWESARVEVKVTSMAEDHWQTENVKGVHYYTLLGDVFFRQSAGVEVKVLGIVYHSWDIAADSLSRPVACLGHYPYRQGPRSAADSVRRPAACLGRDPFRQGPRSAADSVRRPAPCFGRDPYRQAPRSASAGCHIRLLTAAYWLKGPGRQRRLVQLLQDVGLQLQLLVLLVQQGLATLTHLCHGLSDAAAHLIQQGLTVQVGLHLQPDIDVDDGGAMFRGGSVIRPVVWQLRDQVIGAAWWICLQVLNGTIWQPIKYTL